MAAVEQQRAGSAPEESAALSVQGWVDEVLPDQGAFALRSEQGVVLVRCAQAIRKALQQLKPEDVVAARGRWGEGGGDRPALECSRLEVLNRCEQPQFTPRTRRAASPAVRSRYRYLEFRDPAVLRLLRLRHRILHEMSCELDRMGFISVETPILATASPSGAREFRVTSSRDPGVTYALPQSPQVYGQLLVAGGIRAYYQLARCFRDEDLRSNRQPEFTQLHLEMGFVDPPAIMRAVEQVLRRALEAAGLPWPGAFPRMPYEQVMQVFGSDKPDLRFDSRPQLLPHSVVGERGRPAQNLILLHPPEGLELSAEDAREMEALAARHRFTFLGFAPPRRRADEKFAPLRLTRRQALEHLRPEAQPSPGAVALWEGRWRLVDHLRAAAFTVLRRRTPPAGALRFVWVSDFPLFVEDAAQGGKLVPANHPFTAPADPAALLRCRTKKQRLKLRSLSFDLVLNGEELGSGSLLVSQHELQRHMLNLLGYTRRQIQEHFGFLLESLRYGAPPIGGFGLGVDRLVANLCGEEKIRQVIAFPKTKQGHCPVTQRTR